MIVPELSILEALLTALRAVFVCKQHILNML